MYTRNVKALGVAALLCFLLPAAAFAKDPEGTWTGTFRWENSAKSVDAEVNFKDSTVRFQSPYRCTVPIKRAADEGSLTYTFGVSSAGGMFCQGLMDAKFVLTLGSDGKTASAEFTTTGTLGRGKWAGKLQAPGSSGR